MRPALFALLLVTLVVGDRPHLSRADARTEAPASDRPPATVAILCYHHLSEDAQGPLETVSPAFLRAQIRAAKEQGWTFLPLSEVIAARERLETLPPRTMVLTFDDAYRSFREHALPILREENVKATLAVVTGFVEKPPAGAPPIMTWNEIREAEASGLVEIASHTHELHRYETGNAYRDTWPAVTVRRYRLTDARYENRDEYRERIRQDLARSQEILERELKHRARVLVWPYGEHNRAARELAAAAGFEATLALGNRTVGRDDGVSACLPRVLVQRTLDFADPAVEWMRERPRAMRAAQVDLDALYDADDAVFRKNLDRAIEKLRAIGATHVILQTCPDPAGDGRLRETWFANHQTRTRADVWSMVAAKLAHARLKVWARAPSMNLGWEWERHPEWRIPFQPRRRSDTKPWYFRVSPDLPEVRRAAIDFYTDLAVYLPIEGILFDDDAYLLPEETLAGHGRADLRTRIDAIQGLLAGVQDAVRAWRPGCRFARNLYAPVVERRGPSARFAQDFERSLRDHDLAVVMAYARMEGHERDAGRWTRALARTAVRRAGVRDASRVVLKLQAYDWRLKGWVPEDELLTVARAARREGITSLGVYPVFPNEGELPPGLLEALEPGDAQTASSPH